MWESKVTIVFFRIGLFFSVLQHQNMNGKEKSKHSCHLSLRAEEWVVGK